MLKHEHEIMAFVIMPFEAESDNRYHSIIKPACQAAGLVCRRADELVFLGDLQQEISSQIEKSDLIIADLTGVNTNVWYELGYATALRKKIILIASDPRELPLYIAKYRVIEYSTDQIRMKKKLIGVLKSFRTEEERERTHYRVDLDIETKTKAIVVGDLVGSVSIARNLGELGLSEFLTDYLAWVGNLVKDYEGLHFSPVGDGFLALFGLVEHALACSRDIAGRSISSRKTEDAQIRTRIAIHLGLVGIRRTSYGVDLTGEDVILVARLADTGDPGEILLTENAARSLPPDLFAQLVLKEQTALKGGGVFPPVFVFRPIEGGKAQ